MKTENPLVTICSTTYNREKYIAQAIESWLMQEVTFPIEIIIGDNCSTDCTREIIQQYQEKYPGKITLLTSDQNYGMMRNFFKVIEAAKGKYIANCDGDDYWIDPHKLRKQVSFLEENPDFSSIYTNSYVIDESTGEKKIAKLYVWDEADTEELLGHHDFINDNLNLSPGHISSIMFRNFLIKKYPQWLYKCDLNDFPLFMMLSKFGKAKFINEVATVYRVHSHGISSFNFSYIKTYMDRIYTYKMINDYFDRKFASIINPLISRHFYNIFKYYYQEKKLTNALSALARSIYYDKSQLKRFL